jgi:hypothetical protein
MSATCTHLDSSKTGPEARSRTDCPGARCDWPLADASAGRANQTCAEGPGELKQKETLPCQEESAAVAVPTDRSKQVGARDMGYASMSRSCQA